MKAWIWVLIAVGAAIIIAAVVANARNKNTNNCGCDEKKGVHKYPSSRLAIIKNGSIFKGAGTTCKCGDGYMVGGCKGDPVDCVECCRRAFPDKEF